MLEQGKRYRLPDGTIVEVIEVNWSCAVVRPVGKRRVEFDLENGDHVGFDRHARSFTISPNSIIEEVNP